MSNSIPYEGYINYTGDVQIKVNGETYFDFNDLYIDLDNYDVVSEDEQVTAIVGAMTPEQFRLLVREEDDLIDIDNINKGD